jgi:hypothetical protein
MKTISQLRKEVLRDHLPYEIKGNEANLNLYKSNKQSIKLGAQK